MTTDYLAIARRVRSNHRKLASCPEHEFTIDLTPLVSAPKRWRCTRCEGDVSGVEKLWYQRGRAHEHERHRRRDDSAQTRTQEEAADAE